jgi:hypothetical protein
MYGLTRATTTVLAAAAAGFLLWIATRFSNDQVGGYWARIGLLAAAGFVMALPRLAGGRRKLGSPRLLIAVLLFAFVPVAVASLWVIVAGEPGAGSFHNHVLSWTRDIRVSGLVTDLLSYAPVLAFGTGLVFGFSFETTRSGMRDRQVVDRRETVNRRQRSGFLAFGRRHDEASSAVSADAPAPSDRKRTVETRHREPAVTEIELRRTHRQVVVPEPSAERASVDPRENQCVHARSHTRPSSGRTTVRPRPAIRH